MTKAAAKKADKIEQRKILSGELQRAEFARANFRVIINDIETTLDDILKPEYWVNVGGVLQGNGMHPFPIVELIWADGSRYVEVIVLAARNLYAKVKVLHDVNLSASGDKQAEAKEVGAAMENGNYDIKWVSPATKFAVIRKSDGERLTEGLATKQEAQQWLSNLEKAL